VRASREARVRVEGQGLLEVVVEVNLNMAVIEVNEAAVVINEVITQALELILNLKSGHHLLSKLSKLSGAVGGDVLVLDVEVKLKLAGVNLTLLHGCLLVEGVVGVSGVADDLNIARSITIASLFWGGQLIFFGHMV
jgi:hypothetical protein